MINACVLVSGNLGLVALKHLETLSGVLKIATVFTDRASTAIQNWCNENHIPMFIGNPKKFRREDLAFKKNFDLLLSVNYLFIVEKNVLELSETSINLHGSLLPKFRGRTPHVWAIIEGEEKTGVTAHLMNEKVDDGDIVVQKEIEITAADTGGSILKKFESIYPIVISEVIEQVHQNKLNPRKQDFSKATYFGKRTPDDGKIDWNWTTKRIQNWIRAQARPYPGAFFFYEGKKVVVHQASEATEKNLSAHKNGQVVAVGNDLVVVKTGDSLIQLSELEGLSPLNFEVGKKVD